jgi:hypothetical protein
MPTKLDDEKEGRSHHHPKPRATNKSDAITHVNVLREQVVRRLVVLQRVGIDARAGERASKEEAKEPVHYHCHSLAMPFVHSPLLL